MRIGWATPFNVKSAIGKYSRFVCEELQRRGYAVEIIRTEVGEARSAEALSTELPIRDAADADVWAYDVLAVNFGNHSPYHAQLVSLVAERAPLGIFHDVEMRHFQRGMHIYHHITLPNLACFGGEATAGGTDDLVDPEARPVLAALAAMSCAGVVHGPHYRETVSNYCPGEVDMFPLCYPDESGGQSRRRPLQPGRRVTLFGVIHELKQPLRVMEALSMLRERVGPVELHLGGDVEEPYQIELRHEAARLGIAEPVFHGYVSDEDLQDLLEQSHAVCCLRYPVSEGSSASLITALYRARPLIVPDVASFAGVPDDLVYKVSYGHDPNDLASVLEKILSEPDESSERAVRAQEWARRRFSAESYADALEPVLRSVSDAERLTDMARQIAPALLSPAGEPMIAAVEEFAATLDWMTGCQQ